MKIIFVLLLFSISAHSFELLDTKKFQSLSREQQVRYLTEVQKIVVGITKKSPYTAENELTSDRAPANYTPPRLDDDWSTSGFSPATPQTTYLNPRLNALVEKPKVAPKKSPEPKKVVAQPKKSPEPKKIDVVENKPSHFRCMHSGFVIEKDPCTGHQKIPEWIKIKGLTEKNKSCASGLSVCNPIIFGLRLSMKCESLLDVECAKDAEPFCAKRGLWPTEECHQMATAQGNRGTWVAAEISSKIQPALYEKYQQQMKGLCDPEQIKTNPFAEYKNGVKRSDKTVKAVRDDITKTCAWASKQVSLLNEAIADQTSGGNFSKPPKVEGQK